LSKGAEENRMRVESTIVTGKGKGPGKGSSRGGGLSGRRMQGRKGTPKKNIFLRKKKKKCCGREVPRR